MKRTVALAIIAIAIIGVSTVSAQDRMTPNDERDFKFNAANGSIIGYIGKDSRVVIPDKIGGTAVLQIGEGAFKGNNVVRDLVLPKTCSNIGKEAFMNSSLSSITIQNSLGSLGEGAFQGAKYSLSFISNWGNGITKIPQNLYRDSGLTGDLRIPNGVTEIGSYAFANTGITSVTLPASVKSIGDNAFSGCKTLGRVSFPEGLTQIGKSAFSNSGLSGDLRIPNNVTEIGSNAFENSAITSVNLPSSLKSIGTRAFQGCKVLTNVTVPSSVKEINFGAYAFFSNTKLSTDSKTKLMALGYKSNF